MNIAISLLFLFLTLKSSLGQSFKIEDIPYPFHEVQFNSVNSMMMLNRGEEALQKRIDLIQNAQSTIEVEYFIFKADLAGKIIIRELAAAAKRGVKVRLLVDKLMAASGLNAFYAKELSDLGIDIKYYNTDFLLKISSIHYRNHRKLFVVDDQFAITGGRNIGNDYFNLSRRFNFEDQDVLIEGPIVKTMRESFDTFFESEISYKPDYPKRPRMFGGADVRERMRSQSRINSYEKKAKEAKLFTLETQKELIKRTQIELLGRIQLSTNVTHHCPITTFASDAPGAGFIAAHSDDYMEKYRHLHKVLTEKFYEVDEELTISTPYFIANERNEALLNLLLDQDVTVNLYTNSLRSTDTIFMASSLYLHLKEWVNKGMNIYLSDGKWSEMDEAMADSKKSRWGTHAKTHIYENSSYSEVMIGTYNMVNRSDFYNSELAVFCRGNDSFTQELKNYVLKLARKGITIDSNKKGTDRDGNRTNIVGASSLTKLKMKLMTYPSWLFDFLL